MAREGAAKIWIGAGIALVAIFAVVQTFGFARDQHRAAVSEQERDELRRSYVAMFHLVEVPDVRGLPLRSARQALASRMFYVEHVRTSAAAKERPGAVVIAQHPPAGSVLKADSPVTLTALTDWPRPYRYVRRNHPRGPVPVPR